MSHNQAHEQRSVRVSLRYVNELTLIDASHHLCTHVRCGASERAVRSPDP